MSGGAPFFTWKPPVMTDPSRPRECALVLAFASRSSADWEPWGITMGIGAALAGPPL